MDPFPKWQQVPHVYHVLEQHDLLPFAYRTGIYRWYVFVLRVKIFFSSALRGGGNHTASPPQPRPSLGHQIWRSFTWGDQSPYTSYALISHIQRSISCRQKRPCLADGLYGCPSLTQRCGPKENLSLLVPFPHRPNAQTVKGEPQLDYRIFFKQRLF